MEMRGTKPYNIPRPADLKEFVLTIADHAYVIFDKKLDWVRCTRCGKIDKLSKQPEEIYKHNTEIHCPFCGEEAIGKEARYGRKNIMEYGRVLWFRKYGRVTYAQLDEYQIDYTESTGLPSVSFWSSAQYRFCKESQDYYKHVPEDWWHTSYWEKREKIKLPDPARGMWNGYTTSRFEKTVTHTSIEDGLGTDLKYANTNMRIKGWNNPEDPYGIIGYLANFLKYPSIEILEKAGFEKLVGERANGFTCRYVNWRAKDLRKILKMNAKEIRDFRDTGGTIQALERYREIQRIYPKVNFSQLNLFGYWGEKGCIKTIETYTSLDSAVKYLEKQDGDSDIGIYANYLEECNQLGYDMKDKRILRPKDLQTAHEKTSMQINIERDKAKNEDFAIGMKSIYAEKPYKIGDLLIRPAESIEELHMESQALHHCVRTYVDKVCEKRCAILFVRRTSEPDKPYFTLELNSKREVVQCRGDHNCAYPPEVEAFIEQWKKEVLNKRKKGAAAPAA